MKQYLELLRHVKSEGIKKEDRTGTGTLSVFGYQMRFDLNEGFPLVTTKEIHLKSVIFELLWFLQGDTNIKYLNDNKRFFQKSILQAKLRSKFIPKINFYIDDSFDEAEKIENLLLNKKVSRDLNNE